MSDLETFFPDQHVAGFTIRPWTLEQLVRVGPLLDRAFTRAEALGIDLSELDDQADGAKLLRLIVQSLEDVRAVLAITVEKEPEVLDGLRIGQLAALIKAVIAANREELRDFFGAADEETVNSPTQDLAELSLR